MLMVLFSWTLIAGAALIFGKAITDICYRSRLHIMGRPDIYFVTGIIFLNVYAQFFSLFYKVAGIACAILGVMGIVIAVVYAYKWFRIGGVKTLFPGLSRERTARWRWVAFILCLLLTLLWDIRIPQHYDTGLYHAQAIRWIEEYAVVPGLGNLHMRLAYNSAFMCLQALFSLTWLVGESLHTLNGLLCLMALAYVCFTVRLRGEEGSGLSDMLKIVMFIFVVTQREVISSSGTDIMAMLLIIYLFVKWSELTEDGEETGSLYGYLCLVGVYAVTVKLSAASVVVLSVYPLYLFLKEKKLRSICAHVAGAFLIVLPWLIRNVILSGFLIYPFGALDIFHPDWKMDKAVLEKDSLEIKMYARGTPKPAEYETTFSGWVSTWFIRNGIVNRVLILLAAVCILIILYLLWRSLKEKRLARTALFGAALLNTAFWFFTAPTMRYGGAYVYILIGMTLGTAGTSRLKKPVTAVAAMLVLLSAGIYAVRLPIELQEPFPLELSRYLIKQPPYLSYVSTQYPLGNVSIWIPDEGDLTGYPPFPGTPNKWQFDVLRLRGESFQEGFTHE